MPHPSRPATSFAVYLARLIELSPKTQREIATDIGYPKANIITMFKQGTTKVPLEKIPALARALGIDRIEMLRRAMREYAPEISRSYRGSGRRRTHRQRTQGDPDSAGSRAPAGSCRRSTVGAKRGSGQSSSSRCPLVCSSYRGQRQTPCDQCDTRCTAEPMPQRNCLLQQHESSQADDPVKVHHAAKEQQRHQEPAAPETVRAMLQPHAQGAPAPGRQLPIRKPSGERQWRRHTVFIGVSCHRPAPTRMRGAEPDVGRLQHRRHQPGRLHRPLQAGSDDAESAPSDQVAGGERAGRQGRRAGRFVLAD